MEQWSVVNKAIKYYLSYVAKICVVLLSKLTLPKLEVMVVLVATRLTEFAANSLDGLYGDIPVHLWSDSWIVLHWIGSQKKQKLQFVLHCVQDITQTFPGTTCNYCLLETILLIS